MQIYYNSSILCYLVHELKISQTAQLGVEPFYLPLILLYSEILSLFQDFNGVDKFLASQGKPSSTTIHVLINLHHLSSMNMRFREGRKVKFHSERLLSEKDLLGSFLDNQKQ